MAEKPSYLRDRMCREAIQRGPRAGQLCRYRATFLIRYSGDPVCGTHSRAYVNAGLIRLAYWNEQEQAWV